MGCPTGRQQLLQVLGDLGVAAARHAPVDAAHTGKGMSAKARRELLGHGQLALAL